MLLKHNGIDPSRAAPQRSLRPQAAKKGTMSEQASKTKPKPKLIEITIDEQRYEVEGKEMTVREILALACKEADSYYLVEIKGKKEREKYTDPDQAVKLHKGSTFVSVFRGETPVS
jgi:Multiubiquitin